MQSVQCTSILLTNSSKVVAFTALGLEIELLLIRFKSACYV
jgi:hypothetical protein